MCVCTRMCVCSNGSNLKVKNYYREKSHSFSLLQMLSSSAYLIFFPVFLEFLLPRVTYTQIVILISIFLLFCWLHHSQACCMIVRMCVSNRNRSVDFKLIIANIKAKLCTLINWVGTANGGGDDDDEQHRQKNAHDMTFAKAENCYGRLLRSSAKWRKNNTHTHIHNIYVLILFDLPCISFRILCVRLYRKNNEKDRSKHHGRLKSNQQ